MRCMDTVPPSLYVSEVQILNLPRLQNIMLRHKWASIQGYSTNLISPDYLYSTNKRTNVPLFFEKPLFAFPIKVFCIKSFSETMNYEHYIFKQIRVLPWRLNKFLRLFDSLKTAQKIPPTPMPIFFEES